MSIILGQGGQMSGQNGGQAGAGGDITGSGDGLVKDVTDQSFQADVLMASRETPVVVDFWAPWCGPCRELGPRLEEAVRAHNGKVKMVKVNIDENQAIAGQLRVQSIPAVFAFADGRPVDGFMGALPASEIKAFVDKLAGKGPDAQEIAALLDRATQALEAGDIGGAGQDFALVLQRDGANAGALAGLAKCYLANDDIDRAKEMLAAIPEDKANDPAVESARTAIGLAEQGGADTDEIAQLRAAVEAAPGDHDGRFALAKALAGAGKFQAAADALLIILSADVDWKEGAAKAELLTVFDAAGPTSPVTVAGRRKLSALVFK